MVAFGVVSTNPPMSSTRAGDLAARGPGSGSRGRTFEWSAGCNTAFPYPGDLDPARLVDPRDGIDVTMTDDDGAWNHEWDQERSRLTIDADRTADEHTLTITPT